jgi:hypothetical protein
LCSNNDILLKVVLEGIIVQEVSTLTKEHRTNGKLKAVTDYFSAHPLLLAFLLNLAAFLFRIIVFDIKYEVSDDYITDAVLSGAYGLGYDPHLLFGNSILGYFLVFLYKIIPTISFYFILLILLGFISCTVVLYLLFKKKVNVLNLCLAIIFLAFSTDDLYVLIQFTKVAAAAGIAGGLLILHGLWEAKDHKKLIVILGTLLLLAGSMVRFELYLIFGAFLVIAFIYNVFLRYSDIDKNERFNAFKKEIKGVLFRFGVCVGIIGLMFGVYYLGEGLKNVDKTYSDFNTYKHIRSNLTDKVKPYYEDVENEYKKLGLDFVDYAMLNSWIFDDRDVYPDETLIKVAELQDKQVASRPVTYVDVIIYTFIRGVLGYPVAFALYLPALIALVSNKKRLYSLILLLAAFVMLAGFVYYGRTMYRVEWGVYFCAASCIIAGFSQRENVKKGLLKKKYFNKRASAIEIISVIILVVACISRVPRLTTCNTYLNLSDEEYKYYFDNIMLNSSNYVPDKVGFPTVKRKPSLNIIERLENDPDHYYIVDFATGIQDFYFDYDPWIRPEQGLFSEHYAYFGGCTMRHPGEIHALESHGCDPYNPFKNLTKENILLVDNWGYDYKLEYFRRYYCPEAEMELVEVIDGYSIWRFYVPENAEST